MSGQLHAAATLPPGKEPRTHWRGGWVGPRSDMDVEKIKIVPLWGLELRPLGSPAWAEYESRSQRHKSGGVVGFFWFRIWSSDRFLWHGNETYGSNLLANLTTTNFLELVRQEHLKIIPEICSKEVQDSRPGKRYFTDEKKKSSLKVFRVNHLSTAINQESCSYHKQRQA
jgi:hypothetical protein